VSWLAKIFGGGVAETAEKIGGVVERFAANHLGKKELVLELEKILHEENLARMEMVTSEITAKERIMVAELNQGDKVTKWCRPAIIYTGLVGVILQGIEAVAFTLPADFWMIWGGVCSVYVIGRSTEKVKAKGWVGKAAGMVAGKTPSILRE